MRTTTLVAVMLTVALIGCSSEDLEPRAAQSRAAVKEFMLTLKGELKQALERGGAVNAISVCKIKAPAIADDLSTQKGWRVARTSLKVRNPSNAPDDWERSALEDFDERNAQGENPDTMEYYEVVEESGGPVFRYMKAIPTGHMCLQCHGENIDVAVAAKLESLYPADQARGFKAGDIRGAFTITQPMTPAGAAER
jgi:hypothetical protein